MPPKITPQRGHIMSISWLTALVIIRSAMNIADMHRTICPRKLRIILRCLSVNRLSNGVNQLSAVAIAGRIIAIHGLSAVTIAGAIISISGASNDRQKGVYNPPSSGLVAIPALSVGLYINSCFCVNQQSFAMSSRCVARNLLLHKICMLCTQPTSSLLVPTRCRLFQQFMLLRTLESRQFPGQQSFHNIDRVMACSMCEHVICEDCWFEDFKKDSSDGEFATKLSRMCPACISRRWCRLMGRTLASHRHIPCELTTRQDVIWL